MDEENPYQAPASTESPHESVAKPPDTWTSGQIALIYLAPSLFILLMSLLGVIANSDIFLTLALIGGGISTFVAPLMITKIQGDRANATIGTRVGLFILNLIAQFFIIAVVSFGGCVIIFRLFSIL